MYEETFLKMVLQRTPGHRRWTAIGFGLLFVTGCDNERRVGYSWYGNWPRQLLATTYPAWEARWGE